MKDIPVFATEYGVAALSLQQIPYTGTAYITIQSTQMFGEFLSECVGFCRAVGAERIVACGDDRLDTFPVYTRLLKMQMPMPEGISEAFLFPVTNETLDPWMRIYNSGMRNVPDALILSRQMAAEFLNAGTAYFVHKDQELLGVGVADGDTVRGIVSCQKGAGEEVMLALCSALNGDAVRVEVADNNIPAMKLYSRMGFVVSAHLKTWYDVTK